MKDDDHLNKITGQLKASDTAKMLASQQQRLDNMMGPVIKQQNLHADIFGPIHSAQQSLEKRLDQLSGNKNCTLI